VGLVSRCRSLLEQSTGAFRVPLLLLTVMISAVGY
jgi:hypothetical protein